METKTIELKLKTKPSLALSALSSDTAAPSLSEKKADADAVVTVQSTPTEVPVFPDSAPATTAFEPEYPTGIRLVLLTIALAISVFLVALDNTIVATVIPRISDHFNSLQDVGWYGSACVHSP